MAQTVTRPMDRVQFEKLIDTATQVRLVNRLSGRVLEVDPNRLNDNGLTVRQGDYTAGLHQLWTIQRQSNGLLKLVNKARQKVLEVDRTRIFQNGRVVQMWDNLTDRPNQEWDTLLEGDCCRLVNRAQRPGS